MHFCFVSTRRGSHFMTELLSAVSVATASAGHTVELAFDRFPELRDDCVYVAIPHEFQAWGDPEGFPDAAQRERTIALCTENPGTEWFEHTYQLVPQFAAAVSINRSSAAELRRRGIRCEHLQLGYSPLWDLWQRDEAIERPIDVLYLGAADPRRDPLLAGLGAELWDRDCQFLVPPLEPRTRPRPDFLKEAEKYQRLRSAKVLLNLHRTTSSALEWMRFLEAICNGCVVVSEPCLDGEPLAPGEHFLAANVEEIPAAVNRLLDQPDELRLIRERAYDFVREQLPMEAAGHRLAELAVELPRQPPGQKASPPLATETSTRDPQPPPHDQLAEASPNASPAETAVAHSLLRSISARLPRRRNRDVRIATQTPAYAHAKPRVTVLLVATDSQETEAAGALASTAAARYDALEVLLLSDSTGGRQAAAMGSVLDAHPSLPALLLRQDLDHGLGHSLNTLVSRARGEFVFILDPTGGIYPSTLERLVDALDADPQAIFAYPMVGAFDGTRPVGLLSSLPWEPERLARGNWIDAMALIRRERLLELGGYTTDPTLAGWEAFELWCKCAESGGQGVHIPQILAWHRQLAALTTDDAAVKWALMRRRFPRLLPS
jgi:CTP:molybdopterin cytidylyltransferase MocA